MHLLSSREKRETEWSEALLKEGIKLKRAYKFFRCRLPGGNLWMPIKNSRRRMKENPECEMYRRIYHMNIRCYFHFGKNYHLMDYVKAKNDLPTALFHVTSGNNAEMIMRQGLRNEDTKIIFLTNAKKYLEYFLSIKENPTLLCVDVHRMARDGYAFFRNEQDLWMWIAECIPPEYLSVTTIDSSSNLLI